MTCKHPYCDAEAVYRGLFCCESCKVGYHQNHRARLEALEAWLVKMTAVESNPPNLIIVEPVAFFGSASSTIQAAARQLYRVAHGYVAGREDKPKEGLAVPKMKQTELVLPATRRLTVDGVIEKINAHKHQARPLDNVSTGSGYQCGKCKRGGFTKAGLTRHKCKG